MPFLKLSGSFFALAKPNSVMLLTSSVPFFHRFTNSEDHVTSYLSATSSFSFCDISIILYTIFPDAISFEYRLSNRAFVFASIALQAGELVFHWNKICENKIFDMELMPDNDYFVIVTANEFQVRNTEDGEIVNTYKKNESFSYHDLELPYQCSHNSKLNSNKRDVKR